MKALGLLLALLASGCVTHIQGDRSAPSSAAKVLARMKAACGGSAWDRVQGWHETGVVDVPGRPRMSVEARHDMRTLKTSIINRIDGKVVRQFGFDGESYWQAGPDGSAKIGQDPAQVRRQRRDAYLSSAAWFFPDRFPASIVLVDPATRNGETFEVLRITPEAAESFDLWVDRATYHVRRIVAGAEYAELSGHRMFGGVCSATIGRQGDGDPARDIVLYVVTIETDRPVPAGQFGPPTTSRPPR